MKRAPKCDACRRVRDLTPVTVSFALSFDGAARVRSYLYLCAECHRAADDGDEVIGTALQAAVCTTVRAMRKETR